MEKLVPKLVLVESFASGTAEGEEIYIAPGRGGLLPQIHNLRIWRCLSTAKALHSEIPEQLSRTLFSIRRNDAY